MNTFFVFLRILLATCIGVLLSPVIVTAMISIRFCTRQSSIFTQIRIGKDLTPFKIYKLRTMITVPYGKEKAFMKKEDYITNIGHILRLTKIDELPQLLNIIKGEMNFIGPRPLRELLHCHYEYKIPRFCDRNAVKPGMIGISQIVDPNDQDRAMGLAYDLYYIRQKSAKIYLMIIFSAIIYIPYKIFEKAYSYIQKYWLQQVSESLKTVGGNTKPEMGYSTVIKEK